MEEEHPENGDSPFIPRGGEAERVYPSHDDRVEYVECPIEDCDEFLAVEEMDAHLQIHTQLDEADDLDSIEEESTTATARSSTTSASHMPARSQRSASRNQRSSDRIEKSHEKGARSKKHALTIRRWADIFKPKSQPKKRPHREKPPREVQDKLEKVVGNEIVESTSPVKRLGKADLGKYHNEKQMPSWLVAHLSKNWGKRQAGEMIRLSLDPAALEGGV